MNMVEWIGIQGLEMKCIWNGMEYDKPPSYLVQPNGKILSFLEIII